MSIIALFNAAKDYLHTRKTDRQFRQLDDHVLKDIGFYRDNGRIRPLAGNIDFDSNEKDLAHVPPCKQPSDG